MLNEGVVQRTISLCIAVEVLQCDLRLTLDRIPDGAFQGEFARQLSGEFYQGVIKVEGAAIGRIFFGRWQ